jgi:hypothetical protein
LLQDFYRQAAPSCSGQREMFLASLMRAAMSSHAALIRQVFLPERCSQKLRKPEAEVVEEPYAEKNSPCVLARHLHGAVWSFNFGLLF